MTTEMKIKIIPNSKGNSKWKFHTQSVKLDSQTHQTRMENNCHIFPIL